MNILVCMKTVPATTQVQTDGQFRLKRDGVKLQWNIADEAALEAALENRPQTGSVTVLTMGPGKLEDPLRELLARGADRAILLTDQAMAGADTLATARALASAVRHLGGFDLILCGSRAIDGETGQVPGMLAAELNLPCITNAQQVQWEQDQWEVLRRQEKGSRQLAVSAPAVVSVCPYTYTLRLPGILSMRRAKDKTVEKLCAADLGLSPEECGLKGSATKVVAMENKFPGLRKGPKETDIATFVANFRKEVAL